MKNNLSLNGRREAGQLLVKSNSFPVELVCRVLKISKTAYYYKNCRDDSEVINKLRSYAEKMPTRGFGEYRKLIRKEGIKWNHKRIKRVYNLLKLNIRHKHKRRLPDRIKSSLVVPIEVNHTWSIDFMHDSLTNCRKIKVLNLIYNFNREALAIEINSSLSGSRVKRVLERVMEWRGRPKFIRTDNGPEFICTELVEFCKGSGIELIYIQPGKPMQNGYIERFNRFYREDVLDAYQFNTLQEVRLLSEEWMEFYNEKHPHDSLKDMSPREYLEAVNSGILATHQG